VIFQDRADVAWGQNWQQRIDEALDVATLLLVIITPGFFSSAACRAELEWITPVMYLRGDETRLFTLALLPAGPS
jgi:hypothetical protein